MKQINIFVAGSKALQDYREKLVLWANCKNYNYRKKNVDLQLNIYSFREVGDDQDTYNKVITEDSDIILFIIDGGLGDKTKEELMHAKKASQKDGRPEIWVLVNQADEKVFSYLEGALGREFSIDFTSSDDLINQVSIRLDKYVDHKLHLPSADSHHTVWYKRSWAWKAGLFTVLCLIGMVMAYFVGRPARGVYAEASDSAKAMLLIAGGGSVANFIEGQPGTQIPVLENYPEGYFIHLPTKSAWKLLTEEVVSRPKNKRYYPVCISAVEATDDDLCGSKITKQMFLDSAVVLSCKLGEDSLAVYLQKDSPFFKDNAECLYSKHITVPQLKTLVTSREVNTYSTSYESGTRAGYCKVLGIENPMLNEYLAGQYSETSPISSVSKDGKPYLLLGSQYYQMKEAKADAVQLTVQTSYAKPMMIYFMAYRKEQNNDRYQVPRETMKLLSELRVHEFDRHISADGFLKLKNHDHVIYSMKDLYVLPSE